MSTPNIPTKPDIQLPQPPEIPPNGAQTPVSQPPPTEVGALQTLQTLAATKKRVLPTKKILVMCGIGFLLIMGAIIVVLSPQKKWGVSILNGNEQGLLQELDKIQKESTSSADFRPIEYPYVGSDPFLPKRLRVYRMHTDYETSTTLEQAQIIAKTFLFEGDPETIVDETDTKKYEWYNSLLDKVLNINTRTGELNYNWSSGWEQATPSASLAEYESSAARFLISREIPTKFLTTATNKTGYLTMTEQGWKGTDQRQEAHGVQVFFEYQVSGLPLADYYFGEEPVRVIMDSGKNVVDLSYTPFDSSRVTLVDEYSAKDLDTALTELAEGEKALVYKNSELMTNEEFAELIENLQQGRLAAVYPAYFQSAEATKILQPIYVFEGEGEVAGETIKFQVYLPAVNGN